MFENLKSAKLNLFGHLFTGRKLRTPPTTAQPIPLSRSHIDLSVGEPVKKREKLEATELEAFTPKIIKTTPRVRNAMPRNLLIASLPNSRPRFYY